jgi:hypothetical protein
LQKEKSNTEIHPYGALPQTPSLAVKAVPEGDKTAHGDSPSVFMPLGIKPKPYGLAKKLLEKAPKTFLAKA